MKKFVFLMMTLAFIGLMLLGSSCTKRDIKPDDVILWENNTSDTITIFINDVGKDDCIGLMPHQSRLKGSAEWFQHTYMLIGTATRVPVKQRNTIFYRGY